jgi:cobalamin synthase
MKSERETNIVKDWLHPLTAAWEMLYDVKLPSLLTDRAEDSEADSSLVVINFPVAGAIVGLAAYILALILTSFPGNPAAAIIVSVAVTIFLELLTSGRNLALVMSFTESLFNGRGFDRAWMELDDNIRAPRSPVGVLSFILVFLYRVFCFGLLVNSHSAFWFVTALTAGCAAQAHLSTSVSMNSDEPFLGLKTRLKYMHWVVAAVIMLVIGWSNPGASACAVILTIAGACAAKAWFESKFGGVNGQIITFSGAIAELAVLLLGIAFFIRA